MVPSSFIPIFLAILISIRTSSTNAIRFDVKNKCPYTVWAASFPVGGGHRLDSNQTWSINVPAGTKGIRIWARTGCKFDQSGRGHCLTGDCNGQLKCKSYGKPPATLARMALNAFLHNDFFDISLVEGFNVPMDFSPNSGNCTGPKCTADIMGHCPSQLRTKGGCNGPCAVFGTAEYCCTNGSCGPTDYSRFFKSMCPDAYSYPTDNSAKTILSCPSGTTYSVIFCP